MSITDLLLPSLLLAVFFINASAHSLHVVSMSSSRQETHLYKKDGFPLVLFLPSYQARWFLKPQIPFEHCVL